MGHSEPPTTKHISEGIISAFIIGVTVVVVAIPEGLPLAVTISLAYSTKKMYKDKCFIRQLAACETMGNATTICSDKTGTLTENKMTVVEGWFGGTVLTEENFIGESNEVTLKADLTQYLVEQIAINRTAYLIFNNPDGSKLDVPVIVGNKTEGALINMIRRWGFDHEAIKKNLFDETKDRIFPFNSDKKRSTAIVKLKNGTIRLYCKGASEWVLKDCTAYTDQNGGSFPMDSGMMKTLKDRIDNMARRALRTLLLAHRDFPSMDSLPSNWMENPPDDKELCADCIVGIIDPLRSDVKEAVLTAQRAGVIVRMVTGDNILTASAIARQAGILTPGGISIEGPVFRNMTPAEVDAILPRLQVMARSSPEDKYLLVTRLNGYAIPATKEEWTEKHLTQLNVSWENDRDRLLPGYKEEWLKNRKEGGQVVGVTGDGTNDAPALKGADVGLAMGITGTKVAQGAADVVILDDKFSSIVKAILWGRCVYDNIRRFLQFQLTVNVVALCIVFIGAVAGFGQPLNAVQLLWVNLVMDTLGALALGTEPPTTDLLNRRPYKRNASLLSRPMWRNIIVQSIYQLTLLLVLLFKGAEFFGVRDGVTCAFYYVNYGTSTRWNPISNQKAESGTIGCQAFHDFCPDKDFACFNAKQVLLTDTFRFSDLDEYAEGCLTCRKFDYTHGTIIFNTFIFAQLFNEYSSRKLFDELNIMEGIQKNAMFLYVSIISVGLQIFLVEVGGEFVKTTPLDLNQWLITIALGIFIHCFLLTNPLFMPLHDYP